MTEFNNRIAAQRGILRAVNGARWSEELYGLSRGALERWIQANGVDENSRLVILLTDAAEKLFFLANKSQEQVTKEYRFLSAEVSRIAEQIAREVGVAGRG